MRDQQAPPDTCYVYVLVRKDLPHPHRSVQACHAAIAAAQAFPSKSLVHPHLVLCEVADEAALAEEFERLKEKFVPVCAYNEDDMRGAMTAIATGQIRGVERRKLRHLRLLKD